MAKIYDRNKYVQKCKENCNGNMSKKCLCLYLKKMDAY